MEKKFPHSFFISSLSIHFLYQNWSHFVASCDGLLTGKKVTRVTVVTMVEVDRVPMVNMDTITRDTMVEVTTVAVTMVIVLAHRAKKLALRANNLESGSGGA